MPKVMVLLFHPRLEKSRINSRLLAELQTLPEISVRDVYELYPDFDVDVQQEQQLLLQHDIVVFHHPFYWYSCPPLMKQYIDLVLEHGWAYGSKGKALQGKFWQEVITSGGPPASYQSTGMNRYTVDQFLVPFEQTARLCNMEWLAPFAIQGTHKMEPVEIEVHAARYRNLLKDLCAYTEESSHA